MKKLFLNPNVSVGPFVFGTEQKEMWKIMKKEFGSERELPVFESEDYQNPHVQLEYIDRKLISVTFIDDIRERYCEIYLGKEKIWPRTEKKFLSIFGRDLAENREKIPIYFWSGFICRGTRFILSHRVFNRSWLG